MKIEKAKHTPAPWIINTEDGICIDAALPDGRFVARCEADDGGSAQDGYIQYSEGMENARLIAAAPDLLAACKAFFDPKVTDAHARIMADNAITKAEAKGE